MLPKRADPVAGALVATFVLMALLAPPLLIVALVVWAIARAGRRSASRPKPEHDPEFRARFERLEESILTPRGEDSHGREVAATRPRKSRGRRVR